jgi:hypothetical protein
MGFYACPTQYRKTPARRKDNVRNLIRVNKNGPSRPRPVAAWMIQDKCPLACVYRLRRSRRAFRFLLPILRRRRGLAMRLLLSVAGNNLQQYSGENKVAAGSHRVQQTDQGVADLPSSLGRVAGSADEVADSIDDAINGAKTALPNGRDIAPMWSP